MPRPRRQPLLALQHPAWTVVCAALLLGSLVVLRWHLVAHRRASEPAISTLGRFLPQGPPAPPGVFPPPPPLLVARENGGTWEIILDPDESADAGARAAQNDPTRTVDVLIQKNTDLRGLYDPMRFSYWVHVRARRMDGSLLAPDRLPSLIAALEASPVAPAMHRDEPLGPWTFEPGQASREGRLVLRAPAANNAAAALAALGLLWSLGWIPRRWSRRRRQARLAAGLCPGCGYDRRATPPDAPCPECGSPFLVDP